MSGSFGCMGDWQLVAGLDRVLIGNGIWCGWFYSLNLSQGSNSKLQQLMAKQPGKTTQTLMQYCEAFGCKTLR